MHINNPWLPGNHYYYFAWLEFIQIEKKLRQKVIHHHIQTSNGSLY